jgi:transcriptional repressor NrdR
MRCPACSMDDDRVVDSRLTDEGTAIRRRRECNACSHRFTTYERVEGEEHLRVIKRDGSVVMFDRKKLLRGMMIACEKRPVSTETLEGIANRIEQGFLAEGRREAPSTLIGTRLMEELRKVDQVAYVRFASVYRQFKDLDDFLAEVKAVIGDQIPAINKSPGKSGRA